VFGEEFVLCPGSTKRIEDGANTLLQFAIGRVERIELLGDVWMRRVDYAYVGASAGRERYVPDCEYEFLVAFSVEVHDRVATANVLVHDVQQQRGLAHATHAWQVGLHGSLSSVQ